MANDIATHLHAQIVTPQPDPQPDPAPEPRREAATVAFDRMARTIRRTILLARSLHRPARETTQRTLARKQILRTVEDTITRKADAQTSERLHAELAERIEQPDLEDEIGARPTEDIIQDILRDLGIGNIHGMPNTWTRRTPTDLEALHPKARSVSPPRREGAGGGSRATSTRHPQAQTQAQAQAQEAPSPAGRGSG